MEGGTASVADVFEFILAEWGTTPDYIVEHWTDEILDLMLHSLLARKRREAPPGEEHDVGSEEAALARMNSVVKVEKRYAD